MLFNSLEFIIFFPIVVGLYFVIPKKYRWLFLLGSSYYFYMSWNPKYILLILLSTVVDYFAANKMSQQATKRGKKQYLFLSLIVNLGLLIGFKYLNFVDENIRALFSLLHVTYPIPPPWFDNILLPVGISFYTFQTLSYTIDVYKGVTKPEKHFGVFALYVAFWPQLVAGPIERSNQLLPQLRKSFDFDYVRVRSGLFRILFGLFKKVVIADRMALFVSDIYGNYDQASGWTIWLGAYMFVFQVYCDFSGYSDIAIGSARVLGFNLMENFRRPFFAKNLADFWTRWHISLSTWLTDYVFFYLGAYKASGLKVVFNVIFVLTLCGLWHGANWPMVISFFIIGIFMAVRYLWQFNVIRAIKPSNIYKKMQSIPDWVHIIITFNMLVFGFMIFRIDGAEKQLLAQGVDTNWWIITKSMYTSMWQVGEAGYMTTLIQNQGVITFILAIFFWIFLIAVEAIVGDRLIEDVVLKKDKISRWTIYTFLLVCILWFGVFNQSEFFYFQF